MIVARRNLLIVGVALVAAGCGALALRRGDPRATGAVNTLDSPRGAAIKGYDPVAYFIERKALRGSPEHAVRYKGADWHFANAANKSLFELSPENYAPQFGGYCAYGVANGYLVKIEPEAWTIRNGRLYLNYDTSVQREWEKDAAAFIAKAEANFPRLITE